MDTDSIHFETPTNVYELLGKKPELAKLFDLSPFPKEFKTQYGYSDINKGKIGTWKVEVCSYLDKESNIEKLDQIVKFECLRSKSYSMVFQSSSEAHIKTKGVKQRVANTLTHEDFADINSFSKKPIDVNQVTFRKNDFNTYTIETKVVGAFSNEDDKRIYDLRYNIFYIKSLWDNSDANEKELIDYLNKNKVFQKQGILTVPLGYIYNSEILKLNNRKAILGDNFKI
jgi:hypothetical protein